MLLVMTGYRMPFLQAIKYGGGEHAPDHARVPNAPLVCDTWAATTTHEQAAKDRSTKPAMDHLTLTRVTSHVALSMFVPDISLVRMYTRRDYIERVARLRSNPMPSRIWTWPLSLLTHAAAEDPRWHCSAVRCMPPL